MFLSSLIPLALDFYEPLVLFYDVLERIKSNKVQKESVGAFWGGLFLLSTGLGVLVGYWRLMLQSSSDSQVLSEKSLG